MTASSNEPPKKTGRFGPGNPGKPKGAVSKINADVKAMVLEALHHAGGAEYLCMQAFDNPKAFMALVSRVLPLTVAGDPDNPLHASISYIANIPKRNA
jgi:hypothetical protein